MEREKQKIKEYQERLPIDINEIEDVSPEEIKEMEKLDNNYWQSASKSD